MATYIILSRLSPDACGDPTEFPSIAEKVSTKIKNECKGVRWKDSFATFGRFDIVDIVEADDPGEVEKAAMIIRSHGHATTETLVATPWKTFLATMSRRTATTAHRN